MDYRIIYLLSKEKYDRINKRLTSRDTDTTNSKSSQVPLSTLRCGEYESPSSNENATISSVKSRIKPDFISKNMLGDRLCDSVGLDTRVSSSDCSKLKDNEKDSDQQTGNKSPDLSQNDIICYDKRDNRVQEREIKNPEQSKRLCMNERKRRADPNEKGSELRASKKEKLDTKEGKIQENSSS